MRTRSKYCTLYGFPSSSVSVNSFVLSRTRPSRSTIVTVSEIEIAAGVRLAAVADGLDSLLYLGLIDREQARELIRSSIALELGG